MTLYRHIIPLTLKNFQLYGVFFQKFKEIQPFYFSPTNI